MAFIAGQHVAVLSGGPAWFGYVTKVLGGSAYEVRIGGTDTVKTVNEAQMMIADAYVARMNALELRASRRVINYVWVGDNPLSHLGLINVLSWCSVGWSVNIYHGPATIPSAEVGGSAGGHSSSAALARLIPDTYRDMFAAYERRINVVDLFAFLHGIDGAVAGFVEKLRASKVPNWAYAAGDIGKSLVGGYAPGIVLDLKIGPSIRLASCDEDVFFTRFVGMKREGAPDVENQCMGCLDATISAEYGHAFLASLKTYLGMISGDIANGEAVFGWTTQTHAKTFRKVKAALVVNESRYGAPFVEFCDVDRAIGLPTLLGNLCPPSLAGMHMSRHVNCGPFRVFQRPGYYNWRQGQDAQVALHHQICVAYTLLAEFNVPRPDGFLGGPVGVALAQLSRDFAAKVVSDNGKPGGSAHALKSTQVAKPPVLSPTPMAEPTVAPLKPTQLAKPPVSSPTPMASSSSGAGGSAAAVEKPKAGCLATPKKGWCPGPGGYGNKCLTCSSA